MAIAYNTSVVRDGLVFYYDMSNTQKSWRGAPATNLFTERNLNNWTKTATTQTSIYRTPFDTVAYDITDSSNASFLNISRNTTVANDTSAYTISLVVKKTFGATSARFGFNTGFNTGGTTVTSNPRFNSDTGLTTVGTSIDLGDWWYWYFTITNNGTGNTNLYCDFFPATGLHNTSDNAIATDTKTIGALMLVQGSTAVRFADGTRSNTQALLDLTNQNTITATSLTYANSGTFSFNGTNNYITSSFATTTGQAVTYCGWLYSTETTSTYRNFVDSVSASPMIWWNTSGQIEFDVSGHTTSEVYRNRWAYVALSKPSGSSSASYYVNGILVGSGTTYTTPAVTPTWFNRATAQTWNGQCPVIQVYNRALSAAEVLQNFNALRGRYGI
jgi:hypothetical protein